MFVFLYSKWNIFYTKQFEKVIKHHTDPPSTEIQTLNTVGPTKHDSWWTVLNVKGNDINYVWNIQGLHAGWKDLGIRKFKFVSNIQFLSNK